jgi:hypothetical protein
MPHPNEGPHMAQKVGIAFSFAGSVSFGAKILYSYALPNALSALSGVAGGRIPLWMAFAIAQITNGSCYRKIPICSKGLQSTELPRTLSAASQH